MLKQSPSVSHNSAHRSPTVVPPVCPHSSPDADTASIDTHRAGEGFPGQWLSSTDRSRTAGAAPGLCGGPTGDKERPESREYAETCDGRRMQTGREPRQEVACGSRPAARGARNGSGSSPVPNTLVAGGAASSAAVSGRIYDAVAGLGKTACQAPLSSAQPSPVCPALLSTSYPAAKCPHSRRRKLCRHAHVVIVYVAI